MEVEIFFYRVDLFPPVLFEQLQRSQYRKSKSSVNLIPWILTSRSKILNISCKECIADLTWSTKVILICSPFENSMFFFLVKILNLTLIHLVIPFKGRLIIRYYIMLLVMELIIANNCFPCSSPEPWGYPSFFFFFIYHRLWNHCPNFNQSWPELYSISPPNHPTWLLLL